MVTLLPRILTFFLIQVIHQQNKNSFSKTLTNKNLSSYFFIYQLVENVEKQVVFILTVLLKFYLNKLFWEISEYELA